MPAGGAGPSRSVLLIDADADTREILGVVLGQAGWEVVATGDLGEGVELARRHRPAAVISEYTLTVPTNPGRSVPDELGRAGVTPRVHIVFTADVREGVAERVKSVGCVHIRKPASPLRVVEELERRLTVEPRWRPPGRRQRRARGRRCSIERARARTRMLSVPMADAI